jgi:hypothetical protein
MVSNDFLAVAFRYAELGYRVFPCAPGAKHPITQHGFKDATTNSAQIEQWWTQHPLANVAIATEGLLVIDIDGVDNPWPGDPERATDLAGAGAVAITPRGGRHYIFRRPEGKNWKCSTGKLAPGVDVRTNNGYIIVAPSKTKDGIYSWAPELELDDPPERLPEPPAWLVLLLDNLPHKTYSSESDGNTIPQGIRNDALTSLAGHMRRIGMTRAEIVVALRQINKDRCVPPLPQHEVEGIATSVAKYTPDQIATAMAEGHWDQLIRGQIPQLVPVSLANLITNYPDLRQPVIHGLLRQGETMNIIAAPKIGKSWLVTDLALAIATGRPWLDTFQTNSGHVLIIDNELHSETSAHRIPQVAVARGIDLTEVGERVFVQNLRGHWQDIFSLGAYFRSLEPGRYRVVILDAMYRLMPRDADENDNGTMSNIYNAIDRYADLLGCSFVLIHHSTKGSQFGKAITDVGAGAGAQSRATDTHLILRPHEENDVVVLEAAVRSWPPVTPRCLRWMYPVWTVDDTLDPTSLRGERTKRARKADPADEPKHPELTWDIERFVAAFVSDKPKTRDAILTEANTAGLSDWKANQLLRRAEARGLIHRWTTGRNRPAAYATIPQSNEDDNTP